jgi:carbon-monoxide dehydrogenase small subunit
MAKRLIRLNVNGEDYELLIEPRKRLLRVIRDELGFTGTKEGCSTGDCGACTLILNSKPVTSCLVLAVDANGGQIATIEGIGAKELHPLQITFAEKGGLQCGFCTPGMIMAAKALLDENPEPTEEEIRMALGGNICRCTGYSKIVEAVQAAAKML